MKSIKTFCKENKNKIIFVGVMLGSAVIGALAYKQTKVKEVSDPYAGQNVISWTPEDKFMNLERVKEILDLNANNTEQFAIFREGTELDSYGCVLLSGNVITEKPEEA